MFGTLFRYIFSDLVKYFLMASGALAGIMSFGGLLRPLTENGLDASQVGKMLTYFMPAMTTYSLPIAALFATTMVYGRLSADNELTACRAAGISWLAIGMPAFVMGLMVAIVSALFLCFVVPTFSLKVERVIYSNLAQLIANKIERTHQLRLPEYTIFAQAAKVYPADPARPGVQVVSLVAPMFIEYLPRDPNRPGVFVPKSFSIAQQADLEILQNLDEDTATIRGVLGNGTRFSRRAGDVEGGVMQQEFGPLVIPSTIREETKFMDIARLQELDDHPERSRRIGAVLNELIRKEQRGDFLRMIRKDLMETRASTIVDGENVYTIELRGGPDAPAPASVEVARGEMRIDPHAKGNNYPVRYTHRRGEDVVRSVESKVLEVGVWPDARHDRLQVDLRFFDCVVRVGDDSNEFNNFPSSINVAMPQRIARLEGRTVDHYLTKGNSSTDDFNNLNRERLKLRNSIRSERHGRASFAVSCLFLVLVGCILGMMFKSGNFLSAFAVSVVPALICITLIVTGQQTCENVSNPNKDPLALGLALIWSGNAIVATMWGALAIKLHRQ